MKKQNTKVRYIGIKSPSKTKKNLQIKHAVEKAVREYKEAFRRLAIE